VLIAPESVSFFKLANDAVSDLRRQSVGYVEGTETEMGKAVKHLRWLAASCYLEPGDFTQHHDANQDVLINLEILDVLFDFLHTEKQEPELLQAIFRLLRALALNQLEVKKTIFAKLDVFLELKAKPGLWENDMALALAEVFLDHEWACLRVSAAATSSAHKSMPLASSKSTSSLPAARWACRSLQPEESEGVF
jgi:hypothetical protein